MTARKSLERAIAIVGSKRQVAIKLGITAQAVGQWDRCPVDRCLALERMTKGLVTRYDLRPDIFGRSPVTA
jgi:DNA-binding transcriptional regulator YdaS (Cro superfamily)